MAVNQTSTDSIGGGPTRFGAAGSSGVVASSAFSCHTIWRGYGDECQWVRKETLTSAGTGGGGGSSVFGSSGGVSAAVVVAF